jgi:hypothetical protein
MNKRQNAAFKMYGATLGVLQSNNGIWNLNAPFSAAVAALETLIGTIDTCHGKQMEDRKGIADDKKAKRKALNESAFAINKIIVFYASTTDNAELLEKVNFTRSSFNRARDNAMVGICEQVHQAAADKALALLPFGVTATMITDLEDFIADFVSCIFNPQAGRMEVKEATAELKQAFAGTKKLVEEQLDAGMELYSISNADFYTKYFNARKIVKDATRKRALQAFFADAENGDALARVKVRTGKNIQRVSSAKGNMYVQNLEEGSHQLTATLDGYEIAETRFNVIIGETTKLVIKMKRQ